MNKEEALNLSVREIKRFRRHRSNKALRKAWNKEFPPYLGFIPQFPDNCQILTFWEDYVISKTIRGKYLIDGWLDGIDYGDA